MSVGPMGMAGSIAGGLPQLRSADASRAEKEATDQARQTKSDRQAESAAGVGETVQDEKASDRDADGRRLWEAPPERKSKSDEAQEQARAGKTPRSKSPTEANGGQLDLRG